MGYGILCLGLKVWVGSGATVGMGRDRSAVGIFGVRYRVQGWTTSPRMAFA